MFYILLVLCLSFWIWILRASRKKFLEPPELPGKLPLIGHGHWFIYDSVQTFHTLKRITNLILEKGSSLKLYLGPQVLYGVADPEESLTITNACLKKHFIYDFERPLFANGLLSADVAATGVSPEECGGIQKQYLPHFKKLLAIFNDRIQKFWLHSDFIFNMTSLKKKQDEVIKKLVPLSQMIIQKKRAEMKNTALQNRTSRNFKPFLELILELSENTPSFTDEQIRAETNTIIAVGHDTSATVLTFCLTVLGSNVKVQEKAYEEVIQVLGNSTIVDRETLSRLVYIEAVLKETMRLYPSVPVIMRQLEEDLKLKNYTLKGNTGVFVLIYGIHRHKMWGPDAEVFRPERWFEKDQLPDPKYYAAFGLGRRSCLGKAYAMMSMKTVLARILQRFRIASDISKMEMKIETMLKPASGHDITLEKRNK